MMTQGKRIGFVDHQLENFHANVYLALFRDQLAARGYVVAGCCATDEAEGRAWATKNEVPYFHDPAKLNDHVDHYMVLAPSDPQIHPELCAKVLPFGKPTYVDKTFAADLAAAQAIFAMADKFGAAVQTSSALRYSTVQTRLAELGREKLRHMVAWCGGRSFGEYASHAVETVVSCMGAEAESLLRRGGDDAAQLIVNFSSGRTAVVNVYPNTTTPYAASLTTTETTELIEADTSAIFLNLAAATLDLFETGKANIERGESLTIRRILDAAVEPAARDGFVKL